MNINNMTQNLFTLDHQKSISETEIKARENQVAKALKVVGSKHFNKALPKEIQKEVETARKALSKHLKYMKHHSMFLNIEGNQKSIAAKAMTFNQIKTADGKTAVLPIGLLALSQLKIKKPYNALRKIQRFGVQDTFAQLHEEYLKNKVQNGESKQAAEKVSTSRTSPQHSTASVKNEEQKPAEEGHVDVASKSRTEPAVLVEEADKPSSEKVSEAGKAQEVEQQKVEEKKTEEKKTEEPNKTRKPQKQNAKKGKKKGFWSSFGSFFKNIFLSLIKFFTGSKEKKQK